MSKPTAIVTGASRGIGRAIAIELARTHQVIATYKGRLDAAESLKAETGAEIFQCDISSAGDRAALVEFARQKFPRLDLLVNNAGIAPRVRQDVLEATEESFDRVININLKGPYFLTQLVARRMIEQARPAQIVNITSVSAYAPSTNRGDYCVAKAGLAMTTKLFAARLAEHGINVYEIRPGIIETDMTGPVKAKYDKLIFENDLSPLKRWGKPEDVAAAVVAIARGHLPFSTGEVINVDGGFHMRRL